MKIAVLCEALIDFKAAGNPLEQDTFSRLEFRGFPGGSPLNVGTACARLGVETGFVGQLSTDLFGDALLEHMVQNGLDTRFVLRSSAPSTLGFVDLAHGHPRYAFLRNGAADALYNPKKLPDLPTNLRFVQFGSISMLSDPTRSSIEGIVKGVRERCTLVFDPNVRPTLIPDKKDYLERFEGWVALSHLVKLSEEDLEWLYPRIPQEWVAEKFTQSGAHAVIVTRGEAGAHLYLESGSNFAVAAPQVQVLDTVGAGDTFTAGLMVALLEGGFVQTSDLKGMSLERWEVILEFAGRAAALNCTRAGCDPPTRAQVEAFKEDSSDLGDSQ